MCYVVTIAGKFSSTVVSAQPNKKPEKRILSVVILNIAS